VVLAHENAFNLCEWLPFGKRLVDRGYHVLAFDFAGDGASEPHHSSSGLDDDVVSAAGYLRKEGDKAIVLMGASKGGTASLSAAVMLKPPPAAVVTLSAPTTFQGVDAGAAVPKLTSPVLYVAAESNSPFAEDAQAFNDTTPKTTEHTLFIAIGGEHGTSLFYGVSADQITAAIDKLLAAHAPPTK
jgi:alpha/beta superfamily hydrolase